MNYAVAKLEFSPDPLSDTTPSWTDITSKCRAADWHSGKAKDLDPSQAGGATFVLRNDNRMFEPEYAAGVFYPNIVPLRRFRLSIVTTAGTTQQGIYYVTDWGLAYPAGTGYSEITVTCVDGFGLLSLLTLPALDPVESQTLEDVISSDNPYAYFTLGDVAGKAKMAAEVGNDGAYKGIPPPASGQQPPMVPGDAGTSVIFQTGTGVSSPQYGRSAVDQNIFYSPDRFTVEAVIASSSIASPVPLSVCLGPYRNANADHIFALRQDGSASIYTTGAVFNQTGATISDALTHHVAATWDGNTLRTYLDGVLQKTLNIGTNLQQGDATDSGSGGSNQNEWIRIGGSPLGIGSAGGSVQISHVAFYESALSASRIAAHAAAALSRGYVARTAGDRIAALATNPLWSVAGIGPSEFTVSPRFQAGQTVLDEILLTAAAETPWGQFYFDDAGNPQYRSWSETGSVLAILGDSPGEVPYTSFAPVYDDELYNTVRATGSSGNTQTVSDAASIGQFLARTPVELSGLILQNDADAASVAEEILTSFRNPRIRIETITLNGANPQARTHILAREIGDLVRVKRRPVPGQAAIDVITTIIGKSKSIDPNGNLTCTWNLARGVNAGTATWILGLPGFTELDSTAILA